MLGAAGRDDALAAQAPLSVFGKHARRQVGFDIASRRSISGCCATCMSSVSDSSGLAIGVKTIANDTANAGRTILFSSAIASRCA